MQILRSGWNCISSAHNNFSSIGERSSIVLGTIERQEGKTTLGVFQKRVMSQKDIAKLSVEHADELIEELGNNEQ